MSEKITQILEKIETNKEILSTMPQNNEKNITKYKEVLKEIEKEYKKYEDCILEEMKKRYTKETAIKENTIIKKTENEIEQYKEIYDLMNSIKTSYERMSLDKSIYRLSKFYKENLDSVNEEILLSIKKMKQCGIILNISDFQYTPYVNEYMCVFFSELKKRNINSQKMKAEFEEIYWKCPDIILQIELNIRYIYLKNKQSIDKFYNKRKEELLSKLNITEQEVVTKYLDLKKNLNEQIEMDKNHIIFDFITKKNNIKDYDKNKINSNYEKIFTADILEERQKFEETSKNISKFLNSLYEYNNYLEFQFIFEDIKSKYLEKENYKNSYSQVQKEIQNKEKELMKLNKSINKKSIFGRKKKENTNTKYNELIIEIKQLYKQLEKNKVYNRIYTDLNDSSTIKDVLYLANSFYQYLTDCMSEKYKDYNIDEIEEKIKELTNFVENPYNTFINNITILEEKDIKLIIKDRYKLLNFNITKEDLEDGNRDSLIILLENLHKNQNMEKSNISANQIQDICNLKDILDKKYMEY